MNSSVNRRRARRPVLLDPILDIVSALRKMSTKPGQAQWRRTKLKEYRDNTGSSVENMGSQIGATARTVQAIASEDRSRFKTHHQVKLLKLIDISHERWYAPNHR
jgi:DNA-binding XRE family transcriptional regulator